MMLPSLSMLAIGVEQVDEYKRYTNFVGTGCGYQDTQSTPGSPGSSDRMQNQSDDPDATYDSDATECDPQTPPGTPELTVFVQPETVELQDPPSSPPDTLDNRPMRRKRCFKESLYESTQDVLQILEEIKKTEAQIPESDVNNYIEKLKELNAADMSPEVKQQIVDVLGRVEQTEDVKEYLTALNSS
jgi:hypothetical protein